ncbi:hypothetical protein CR513_17783, partial [Mucuna pruriens]
MSLLVILSTSLKVIFSVLSRLIGALSWSLMATYVDNKYNLWIWHVVSHKVPQYIFRDSSAFGGIASSYFSESLMDTYGVGLLAHAIVVLVKEQPRFSTARKKNYLLLAPVITLFLEEPLELFLLSSKSLMSRLRELGMTFQMQCFSIFLIFCLLSLRVLSFGVLFVCLGFLCSGDSEW